ncbi:WD40-repeat-containing domain protein [Mucor mucedo]|uniref:WD40-repeat-containing domain protein n=1 Tax=Mucor mucedo TaxID=29922 RepID=UPI0022205779|nr:WD40-repeat-containing domain protein [Mucor mucedo]KAI7888079.1 WD40-repeat-containing domain protein [Mucor mucedo]
MTQAASIASFDTGYSADSTEFCPFKDHAQYLAVGTYQLTDEQEANVRIRKGKTYLFDVTQPLIPQQTIETPAVLDMKWSHALVNDKQVLGIADAQGGVHMYGFNENNTLEKVDHVQATDDPSTLCLSLDWASRLNKTDGRIVTSHSNGTVNILTPTESGYVVGEDWHAHDLEAWIAAFDYWNTNVVYSGADDGLFKGWDIRDPSNPTFVYKRHMMGVTTMQSNPNKEHVLATGSYDETIYIWDTRSMRAPVQTCQTPGGGIWRLKWHPTNENRLLSASMHAGAFVVDLKQDEEPVVSTSFLDHTSMAYGADWSFADTSLVASCSFYDHCMHLWKAAD